MAESTVSELVTRAKRGDASAFDQLVRRHLRAAYAVALAVLQRPADADDVAQDAFISALERIDDCREPARFSGWLIKIVRNRALNALAKRRLRDADELSNESSFNNSPNDVALRRQLLAALATLTDVQREIVLLHDLDGWSHSELADALGLSEVNCRQHLFTARRALRGELSALAIRKDARHGTGT